MDKEPEFDIETYCETTLAMEYVLQGICSALPKDQAEKVLLHLAHLREYFASLPDDGDGTSEAWKRVMARINPFVEILSGLPPQLLH